MNFEFIKQAYEGMITEGDEIVIYNAEEAMMNGPHMVAVLTEDGEATLVGIGPNEGTVSVMCFE